MRWRFELEHKARKTMQQSVNQYSYPAGFRNSLPHTWLIVNRPRTYTAWLRQRYGDAVSILNPGGIPIVYVFTPEGARQVFSADPLGYDAFWKKGFTGVAGKGSLWVRAGEDHRRERLLLSPSFHPHNFRGYGKVIRQVAREKTGAWQPGSKVRALDTTRSISLDIIMQLVFGVAEGELIEQGREILAAFLHTAHPLLVFFPRLQRDWFPAWRRYQRARKRIVAWITRILAERRANQVETGDVLGSLMSARYEDGSRISDEYICDELITILVAGHETTATALAWALYDLGTHPEAFQRLRAEVDSVVKDADASEILKSPFLAAACNETLRLHTLLPEVARVLVSPLRLFDYNLPPSGSVLVSVMAIHHDPELYPDPDRYNPDRFMERSYSPFEFLPFGGGHRRCLGSGLSDFEMRIVLAEIIANWEFQPDGTEREIRRDISMGPKKGVMLRVTPRRDSH
jgi:cytochrome P450 family 110